jgi:hypothetical protein
MVESGLKAAGKLRGVDEYLHRMYRKLPPALKQPITKEDQTNVNLPRKHTVKAI